MLRHSSLICLWVQTGSQPRASSPSFLMKLRLVSHQLAAEFFFLLLNLSLRLNLSPCIQHCRDCQLRVQFADALGVFVFCLHNQGNQKSTDGKILGPLKLLRRKQRTMSNLRQPRCSCLATSLPVDSLLLPRLKCVSTRYEISIWLSELLIIEREFSWFKMHPPHT